MIKKNIIPNFLIEKLQKQYGEELTKEILNGYEVKRKTTLRVNTIKASCKDIEEQLKEHNIDFEKIPWSSEALLIKNVDEKEIKSLEMYENGKIYLQSLSSMLPPIALQPKQGENILDMAAAPGGKTTQMAALASNKAMITACERNVIRAERLKYNIAKQGVLGTYVMIRDARDLDDLFSFDKILLDAPCSGSGTINVYDENLEKTFTEQLVQKSAKTQLALLKKALKLLKTGKEMVYSTCSILECENEDIIRKALQGVKAEVVPIKIEQMEQIPLLPVSLNGTICICPTEQYEGFFMAKLRKM